MIHYSSDEPKRVDTETFRYGEPSAFEFVKALDEANATIHRLTNERDTAHRQLHFEHARIVQLTQRAERAEQERDALRAALLDACAYIAMNDAADELCIVRNCAYRAGLTPEQIDAALAARQAEEPPGPVSPTGAIK